MSDDDKVTTEKQGEQDEGDLFWEELERELSQSVQQAPLQAASDSSQEAAASEPFEAQILEEPEPTEGDLHLEMEAPGLNDDLPSGSSGVDELEDTSSIPVPLHFTVIPARPNTVVLEQGSSLTMIQKGTVSELKTIDNSPDHALFLADLDQSFGMLSVTGDPRFAAILGRKELEDRGELTADGKFFVHAVHKIESTQSMVLYSIFPRQKYLGIISAYQDHPHGFVLYDPVGLLNGLLQTMPKKKTHALALRMASSLFMIVGKRDEVMQVRRYISFGQDEQSLAETIQTMVQDLTDMQQNLGVEIKKLHWIETLCTSLDIRLPTTQIPVSPWSVVWLEQNGQNAWSALPDLVHRLPVQASVGPKEEQYLKPLDTAINWLLAAGVLLTLAFVVGSFLYKPAPEQLRASMGQLESALFAELESLHAMQVSLDKLDTQNFLYVAEAVEQATLAPTMGQLWNMLAVTKHPSVHMYDLELHYEQDMVLIRLEGILNEPIGRAHEVFGAYVARMEQRGFSLTDQNLIIDLNQIGFVLILEWPIIRG